MGEKDRLGGKYAAGFCSKAWLGLHHVVNSVWAMPHACPSQQVATKQVALQQEVSSIIARWIDSRLRSKFSHPDIDFHLQVSRQELNIVRHSKTSVNKLLGGITSIKKVHLQGLHLVSLSLQQPH